MREQAERYAYLADLSRVLNDDCQPYAGPLLKVALSSRTLPADAAAIGAQIRAMRGLADTTDASSKARVLWFAYTTVGAPAIDSAFVDEMPFHERFYIRPLKALIGGLDGNARTALRAEMTKDVSGVTDSIVTQTLRSLFEAPAASRPRAGAKARTPT